MSLKGGNDRDFERWDKGDLPGPELALATGLKNSRNLRLLKQFRRSNVFADEGIWRYTIGVGRLPTRRACVRASDSYLDQTTGPALGLELNLARAGNVFPAAYIAECGYAAPLRTKR